MSDNRKTDAMKREFWDADIPEHPAQAWEHGFQRGYDIGMQDAFETFRAEVRRMMDEEMSFYETACKDGDEEVSSSPMVYTRLQILLAFVDFKSSEVTSKVSSEVSKKAKVDDAMAEVKEKAKAFTEAHKGETSEEILAQMRGEEPVSEDLEKAVDTYLSTYFGGEREKQDWPFLKKIAIHFADWQKQQIMNDAVDGVITFDYYDNDKTYGCVAHDSFCLEDRDLKDMDKVKLIIVKED